ncbi:MAG: hypothetical protein J6T10_27815 [Methanobrevibacter sp.]|nr:hypothetical protein [Methanobrevibacter sp.]
MRKIQNDCCGCPELRCINCEKGKDYEAAYCDICGDSQENMYTYKDKDYCEDCLFVAWLNNNSEDVEFIVLPGIESIKDMFLYLAECAENNVNELWYYLSAESLRKWNVFRDECEIRR